MLPFPEPFSSHEKPTVSETGEIAQEPFCPVSFFLSKEETTGTSIFTTFRFTAFSILENRLVPRNFHFQKNIALTSFAADFSYPVPIFIEGHALRH